MRPFRVNASIGNSTFMLRLDAGGGYTLMSQRFFSDGGPNYELSEYALDTGAADSVKQIADRGIPMEKIVLGKPVLPENAYSTGYIEPETLRQYMKQAKEEIGFQTGVMTWEFRADIDGSFVQTVTADL